MITIANPIEEIHSSDLTERCAKKVQLRHEGRVIAWTTTALYRGLVAHEAIRNVHHLHLWDKRSCELAVDDASDTIKKQSQAENRPLSEAVMQSEPAIRLEIIQVVRAYAARIGEPWTRQHRIIGTELPIRFTFEHPSLDEPIEFASHLDMLMRDDQGRLCVLDWKWRDDAPTWDYLARHMQFGPYWLGVKYGSVMVDGEWIDFDEWPCPCWIHLPSLKPYGRKTEAKNDDGEVQEFKKGDPRPMRSILRWAHYDPEKEQYVRDEIATRVRMFRAGLFPTNPDPVGCHICECSGACPTWTDRVEADQC